jgi:hypothetical protein
MSMTKRSFVLFAGVISLAACNRPSETVVNAQRAPQAAAPHRAAGEPAADANAKVLADFKTKVEQYAQMRAKLDDNTPPLKKTDDPAAITAAERALADKIRQARPGAKQGEFFTPETVVAFRRMMKFPLKGPEGTENKNAIKDDVPARVPFQINGEYPKQETVSTVAPDVLLSLPALPDNVQYRFVGKHMILYDARANTIIDYFLNAIP